MGRIFMYAAIAALAVFVASSYFLLEHGGGSIAAPSDNAIGAPSGEVTVHDLTLQAPIFDGRQVVTEGTLSFSAEHDRYQIVDDGNFAVVIREYANQDKLAALQGQRVRVDGTFGHGNGFGAFIDAESVEAAAQ